MFEEETDVQCDVNDDTAKRVGTEQQHIDFWEQILPARKQTWLGLIDNMVERNKDRLLIRKFLLYFRGSKKVASKIQTV